MVILSLQGNEKITNKYFETIHIFIHLFTKLILFQLPTNLFHNYVPWYHSISEQKKEGEKEEKHNKNKTTTDKKIYSNKCIKPSI